MTAKRGTLGRAAGDTKAVNEGELSKPRYARGGLGIPVPKRRRHPQAKTKTLPKTEGPQQSIN